MERKGRYLFANQHNYPHMMKRAIQGVINLYKGRRHVQVIIVGRTPFDTLLGFHSTVVMNYITGDKAISLYPKQTLCLRKNLVLGVSDNAKVAAIDKYKHRGWKLTINQLEDDGTSTFNERIWSIGDCHTWTRTFGDLGGSRNSDHLQGNTWRLTDDLVKADVQAEVFGSSHLEYLYTTPSVAISAHQLTSAFRVINGLAYYDQEYAVLIKHWAENDHLYESEDMDNLF
ncbi:hypothetical protein C8J56DRAFT_883154 [Mycena floridula]|nr:hypothetical protein C8J56DRAFT_883154 [Mycena floridula]